MVKHTKKIRRQQPINCLSVFYHFVGLPLKGLNGESFDVVEILCYLGDTIGARREAVESVLTRIRNE